MEYKEGFVKLLNEAFEKEYNDVFLYLKEAGLFRKKIVSGERLGGLFEGFSLTELRHADRIAAKIIELGGKAEWIFRPFESSDSIRDVLERHAVNELAAIRHIDELLILCTDPDFQLVLKGIREDEKEHLAKIVHLKKRIKQGKK
jgi:rubrerythrin